MTGPCGAAAAFRHNPKLVSSRTGTPITFTLFDSLVHVTVKQGEGTPDTFNVHPRTVNISDTLNKYLAPSALTLLLVVTTVT
jgi:hypothetical protein